MQSEAGKLLCSKTALKRCTSTEHLWKRKLASLSSPVEIEEILLPRSFRSRTADALKTPKVSPAIGSNMRRPTMSAYFTSLRVAANSAAAPASRAAYWLLLLFFAHQHKAAGVKTKQKQRLRRLLIRCSLC